MPGLFEFFGKFELSVREPEGLIVEQEGADLIAGDGKDLVGDGKGLVVDVRVIVVLPGREQVVFVVPGNVLVVRGKMLVVHWCGLFVNILVCVVIISMNIFRVMCHGFKKKNPNLHFPNQFYFVGCYREAEIKI
jgi:hypothetical protein